LSVNKIPTIAFWSWSSWPYSPPPRPSNRCGPTFTYPPVDLIPEALIIAATTKVADIEGDEPLVKAPFILLPDEPAFVPEGEEIEEADIDSREVEIGTGKIAILTVVSREQYRQTGVANLLSEELKRAVTVKADAAFLNQPAPTGGRHTPPPGLLVQDHTTGGAINDNLDAVSDAIALIESHSGTADLIIASPQSWAAVSKLKTAEDSNQSLLGPPGVAAARQLLSIPVTVSASVADDTLIVVDKRAVLSAYGALTVAVSEHAAFRLDSIVTRLTWRIGAAITYPERVVELTVGEPTGRGRRRPRKAAGTTEG
jgi:HK97 family phage major capsid protein